MNSHYHDTTKFKAFLTKVWEKFLTTSFLCSSRRRHTTFFSSLYLRMVSPPNQYILGMSDQCSHTVGQKSCVGLEIKVSTVLGQKWSTCGQKWRTCGKKNLINKLVTPIYWEWHLILSWPLRSIFPRSPEQLLKDLISWGSPGGYSMINWSLGDAIGVLSCQFWNTVLQCGVRLPIP